jgi:hypothetical protein
MNSKSDLKTLLKSMNPMLHEGIYVFCTLEKFTFIDPKDLIMSFREAEGTTIIIRKELAEQFNLKYDFTAAWITLMVKSSLDEVGLTAAFSSALADKGISCNVVAGYFHDHLFIPKEDSEKAMEVLTKMSE